MRWISHTPSFASYCKVAPKQSIAARCAARIAAMTRVVNTHALLRQGFCQHARLAQVFHRRPMGFKQYLETQQTPPRQGAGRHPCPVRHLPKMVSCASALSYGIKRLARCRTCCRASPADAAGLFTVLRTFFVIRSSPPPRTGWTVRHRPIRDTPRVSVRTSASGRCEVVDTTPIL